MHGLLASAEAMSHAQGWIEADYPGIYIHNVEIGNGRDDSLFMNINDQVETFAAHVRNDSNLAKGFNVIGHSQGGLIVRAYVERYNDPPVYNLISWAGPMDGVYGVPDVNALCPDVFCPEINILFDALMDSNFTSPDIQKSLSFAAYWKNPFNIGDYLDYNIFLADINNEKPVKNATYKENMLSLNHALLVWSTLDDIVIPRESPIFEFYAASQDVDVLLWNETDLYVEDYIGTQTLYKSGRLSMVGIPCKHQNIPRTVCESFYTLYTKPLLNNTLP